jgi:hypothetical protein
LIGPRSLLGILSPDGKRSEIERSDRAQKEFRQKKDVDAENNIVTQEDDPTEEGDRAQNDRVAKEVDA